MFPYYLYYIGFKKQNISSIDSKVPLLDIQETTKQYDFRSERLQSNYLVNGADTTDVSENSFEKALPSSLKLVENINTANNEKNVSPTNTKSIMPIDNTKVNA